jgi:rhodanese-related sulfurtransferase
MNSLANQASPSIHPRELQRRRAAGEDCEIIDVRTPGEHAEAHVEGVKLVPLDTLDPRAFLAQRPAAAAPLYVICQSGARAAKAVDRLRAAGLEHCVLVEGGTQGWIDAGLPVERGESRVLPLQRQVHLVIGFFTASASLLALTVDARFALISLLTGCGLLVNGSTGWCGLGLLMAKMPWNRGPVAPSCAR